MRKMLAAVAATLIVLSGCASPSTTPTPQVTVTVPVSSTPTPPPAPVATPTPTPAATSSEEELVGILVDLAWADLSKSEKKSMCMLYLVYPNRAKKAFLDGTGGGIAGASATETWAAMKAHLNDVC